MGLSVVVTGASGFIGSALVNKLGHEPGINVVPVSSSISDKSYVFVKDYRDTPISDVLVHLAEKQDRLQVNQAGDTYIVKAGNTLDSIVAKKHSKIIYCSSAAVYGDKGNTPYKEESKVHSYDNYTLMKLNNEQKVIHAGGIVARLANVIGPGMAKNNVLSDILSQLSDSKPLCVKNEKPVRDFIWLDDVVSALMEMITGNGVGIYNIGTGVGVSIKEMAEIALRCTYDNMREVKSLSLSSGHSYNVIDVDKMRNTYGWIPKLTPKQSIEKLIKNR